MHRFVVLLLAAFAVPAFAQPTATTYEILGVSVEGVDEESEQTFVVSIADLRPGERVALPYDEAFGQAVRALYERGQFSNAEIIIDRTTASGVFLTIRVTQEPRLGVVELEGLSRGERDDLTERLPLIRGRRVRPADIEQSRLIVQEYLRERGFRLASVAVDREITDDDRLSLTLTADKGDRVEIEDVVFVGNEAFSERTLRKRLKNTPEDRWWRFWKRETFTASGFEEDKDALIRYYNDRGYYGARVVRDSVYLREDVPGEDPDLIVEVEVEEGPKYHIRDVVFEGNTVYNDDQLRFALGIEPGDPYNRSLIERNLYYSPDHTDVASLYTDRGYLRFNVTPQVIEVPGDSLDLYFEVTEGDVYEFGTVEIAGNTRTKEHVVRREIRTVPGQTYSRQAVERSVRDLVQLNYFDQNSIAGGPSIRPNDETKTVDLVYNLVEASSDQLELSGGYGGSLGLLLTARVTFNNFSAQGILDGSAWQPVPSGDGQQLALQVVTNGRYYQNYSLSFTEPWFRGRPTPVGFSLGYQYNESLPSRSTDYQIRLGSATVFARSRLKWPDDYFQTGTTLGYRIYGIEGRSGLFGLPEGTSQELTLKQTLSRNNLDNPLFPTAGSNNVLAVTLAPPIPGFVQYHKTDLETSWYAPITRKLSLSFKTQFGYIGSLTGEDVEFQRYLVGGSPLETNRNFVGFGKDLVYLRGYPTSAIGPRRDGEEVGGRILNKYQAEIQFVALQTPQLSLAPYVFADAANSWDGFSDYDPSQLYRSTGIGARVILPILGLVDLNYGYGFDAFEAIAGRDDGTPKWRGQVTLGAGF